MDTHPHQGVGAYWREAHPKVPEMIISFNSCANNIKGIFGHLLVLLGNGPIVDEGLQSLSFLTLGHHLSLAPASMAVISLISTDVESFQIIESHGVENFPVLQLTGGIEIEIGHFPAVNRVRCWMLGKYRGVPNWFGEVIGNRGKLYLT